MKNYITLLIFVPLLSSCSHNNNSSTDDNSSSPPPGIAGIDYKAEITLESTRPPGTESLGSEYEFITWNIKGIGRQFYDGPHIEVRLNLYQDNTLVGTELFNLSSIFLSTDEYYVGVKSGMSNYGIDFHQPTTPGCVRRVELIHITNGNYIDVNPDNDIANDSILYPIPASG